jgi:hypothetical protein
LPILLLADAGIVDEHIEPPEPIPNDGAGLATLTAGELIAPVKK